MAIDGIGRKGPVVPPAVAPPPGGTPPAGRPSTSERPFESGAPRTEATAEAAAASPVGRLRSGAITQREYIDLKVDEATSHLTILSPAELESVRNALRDRIASDPALSDLVRTATGSAPQPLEDD